MTRPIALITGASSGIGATFARQLAARGFDLILAARRTEQLQKVAAGLPTRAECITADVANPQDRALLCERLRHEPNLELLVNNAGFGTRGRFWEIDLAGQRRMHEVHVTATLELTHAALGNLVKRGRGAVINVASVAAFSQSQSNVSYCATKSWILAFSECLELELRGIGSPVRVQALCPGFTYTEFHDVLQVDRSVIPKWLWMKADDVVRASLDGLEKRKVIVVPGWFYRIFVSVMPRLPHSLQMALQARSPHTRV